LTTHDMRQLALWGLWSGTCSLPLHLASGMAMRALQDFKLQGFGLTEASAQSRNAVLQLISRPIFPKAYTTCKRSLRWHADDDEIPEDIGFEDYCQDVAVQRMPEGYGELRHKIEVGFCLQDCTVTLTIDFDSEVGSGCEASCHGGNVVVQLLPRPCAQFLGTSPAPPVATPPVKKRKKAETLLSWRCRAGDAALGDPDDNDYQIRESVLHRFAARVFSVGERQFSVAEVLQFLWRALGAPLRWTETLHPYAIQPTFYMLLREAFLRCLAHHNDSNAVIEDDEDLFTAAPSGPNDSDFMNDVSGLREQEKKVKSRRRKGKTEKGSRPNEPDAGQRFLARYPHLDPNRTKAEKELKSRRRHGRSQAVGLSSAGG